MFLPIPATTPIAFAQESGAELTPASILAESTVANLARPQRFRLGQASSYDRRSRTPGTPDWFANDDWGSTCARNPTRGGASG